MKGVRVQNDQIVIDPGAGAPFAERARLLYHLLMSDGCEGSQGKKGKIGPRVVVYVTFADKNAAMRALRTWSAT